MELLSGACDGCHGDFPGTGVEEDLGGGGQSGPGRKHVVEEQNVPSQDVATLIPGHHESPPEVAEAGLRIESRLMARGALSAQRLSAGYSEFARKALCY